MTQLDDTEQTPAGPQRLVEGVQAISTRERLEQAQDKPLRGGNAPCNRGLFDLNARQQLDMFSK